MGPIEGHETAEEAAQRLGYDYSYFRRILKAGRVPGAIYWQGYAIPKSVQREDIEVRGGARGE